MKRPNRRDDNYVPQFEDAARVWLCVAIGVGIYLVLRYFDWFVGHDVRSSYWFLP